MIDVRSCLFQVLLLSLCKFNADAEIYISDVWYTEAATGGGLWKRDSNTGLFLGN